MERLKPILPLVFCAPLVVSAGTLAWTSPALAQVAPIALAPAPLPTFAQPTPVQPSPWAGLTIGGDLSAWGGKGVKGGIGGDSYLTYKHEFANNVFVNIGAVSGYAPNLYRWSRGSGVNYAGAQVAVGYDMGQFQPYLLAGVSLAKANFGAPGRYDAQDSVNDLFSKQGGSLYSATTVGAGFNYAVTNNFSMGVQITATQFNGPSGPPIAAPVAAPIN
jgi:opacity protein-like surface antigen